MVFAVVAGCIVHGQGQGQYQGKSLEGGKGTLGVQGEEPLNGGQGGFAS